MSRRLGSLAALLLALAVGSTAQAEVQFLAKQYARCSACHYSATGGSLLTPYGRSLSREEISSFGRSSPEAETTTSEHKALYGFIEKVLGEESPLDVGIVLRPSRLDLEFGDYVETRDLWMRAGLQAAFRQGPWTVYGEAERYPSEPAEFISREHWIEYAREDGTSFKVGRFLPAFGLRLQDHETVNRHAIGFNQNDQIYGIELTENGESHIFQMAAGPGRAEGLVDDDGSGSFTATARLQMELNQKNVLVLSGLYRGATDFSDQHWIGSVAHGWSPIPRLALWTELDSLVRDGWKGTPQYSVFHEASYEVVRGLWIKASPQLLTELANISGGKSRVSAGIEWFPRAHWNVNLQWIRERDRVRDQTGRTLLLQLNLYL